MRLLFRRKRLGYLLYLALLTLALIVTASFFEAPYYSYAFSSPHDKYRLPRVTAHKAHTAGKIPSTLSGMQSILDSDIGGMEMDIQLSKDGVPVVFHDDDLFPLSSEHGPVSERTAAELQAIHYRAEGAESSETIVTLEQVFQLVGNSKTLFLDIKAYSYDNNEMVKALSKLVDAYDLYDTVIVESFNPIFLLQLRRENPQILRCYDFLQEATATEEESPEQLAKIPYLLKLPYVQKQIRRVIRPDILGVRFSVPREQIRALSDHGYPIIAWTVDDSTLVSKLMEAGVLGVQSNEPEAMQSALEGQVSRVLSDASGLSRAEVDRVIDVESEADIQRALMTAKKLGKSVSIAGSQHTMGGHTFASGNIVLKMKKLKSMEYSKDSKRLRVQSGATWKQVQAYLDPLGRSVKVMQSDNIFTVGGTLSANAHGWQVKSGPISSTVHSFRVMTADGKTLQCSRSENSDLFSGVLGGYGLLGVILDVEIETVENDLYRQQSSYFPVSEFPERFEAEVLGNPKVQLAYGRLSLGRGKLLSEASLNTFESLGAETSDFLPLEEEKIVGAKRAILRLSEKSEAGKWLRWETEKQLNRLLSGGSLTRNTIMNPDIHVLWPVSKQRHDILHEYFIPPAKFDRFIKALKEGVQTHKMNLLNVTIRQVDTDPDTLLAYARENSFAFVLLFSQGASADQERSMEAFTKELIDSVIELEGTFYLPYRLHYSPDQVARAYPNLEKFLEVKRLYDPSDRFTNQFYQHLQGQSD